MMCWRVRVGLFGGVGMRRLFVDGGVHAGGV